MNDEKTTVQEAKNKVAHFVSEREWQQFHTPKNLSMDIAVEAAELMEKFMWVGSKDSFKELEKERQEVEDEAADIFMALLSFCNAANIDIAKAFERKLAATAAKYPVEQSKGSYTKYTKLNKDHTLKEKK